MLARITILVTLLLPLSSVAFCELPQVCKDADNSTEPREKIELYTSCIQQLDSTSTLATAYFSRANSHGALGMHEMAIADYSKAIELEPKAATLYISRATSYGALGKHEMAIAGYSKAIELDPNDAHGYNNLAWTLVIAKDQEYIDTQKAKEYAKKAIELDGNHGEHYDTLACVYAVEGDFDNAIMYQLKAIEVEEQAGRKVEEFKEALADYKQNKRHY